jgi:hypothetical protein
MKNTYRNITDILRLNRFIVLVVVILSTISSGLSLWMLHHNQERMLNSAFAVHVDGSVLPLKLVDQRENRQVEALAHIDRFHRLFYGLEGGNYRTQLEKALRLGDASVDNIYRQKRMEGIYNRLLQYSLRQEVLQVEIELRMEREPHKFRARTVFVVYRGNAMDRYELISSGELFRVDRSFPHNPHGLLIGNFFEQSLRKLEAQP